MNELAIQNVPLASQPDHPDLVVIGGSHGSLRPLGRILRELSPPFDAAVFVVLHRAAGGRVKLSEVISQWTQLPVSEAENHRPIERGRVYIAPADRHLLLKTDGRMHVVHGPRENLARPSIDVLFRSAAVAFGPRVVGAILSGALHDGESGLSAVRRCGGYAIVQDPKDAENGELPRAALLASPDAIAAAGDIGSLINRAVERPLQRPSDVPRELALEAQAAAVAMTDPAELSNLGSATHLSCPECDGPLWLMNRAPGQYRCDVGHSFSLQSLAEAQAVSLERALWVAYRVLNERARLLEQMSTNSLERGMNGASDGYLLRMRELRGHAQSVLDALAAIEAPLGTEAKTLDQD
jgi:two-component system chemotaxis response regulator CheB